MKLFHSAALKVRQLYIIKLVNNSTLFSGWSCWHMRMGVHLSSFARRYSSDKNHRLQQVRRQGQKTS